MTFLSAGRLEGWIENYKLSLNSGKNFQTKTGRLVYVLQKFCWFWNGVEILLNLAKDSLSNLEKDLGMKCIPILRVVEFWDYILHFAMTWRLKQATKGGEVKKELEACKLKVDKKLQQDFDYDSTSTIEHENLVGPSLVTSLHKALKAVGNPRKTLFSIWHTMFEFPEQLDDMLDMLASDMEIRHVGGEGLKG